MCPGHRAGDAEALAQPAAEPEQRLRVRRRFYALRNHLAAKGACQLDDCTDDRARLVVLEHVENETAVDLEQVNRQLAVMAQ